MSEGGERARAVGINHVALEVRDLDEAIDFLDGLFQFKLRSRSKGMAFIELGDQFIALFENRDTGKDEHRHFGLVVDDKSKVKARLDALNIPILGDRFLDFRDPSGNRWQIVEYSQIEFIKAPQVLEFIGASGLEKADDAMEDLRKKGIEI